MEKHVKCARHLLSKVENREIAEALVEQVEAMNYCFHEMVCSLNRDNANREAKWIRKYDELLHRSNVEHDPIPCTLDPIVGQSLEGGNE